MNIKLEQYRVFCAVVKSKSFSSAADALFMTQSAVSQQIKSLEREIGATLFIRSRNGAELTPQGKVLYEYADKALSLFASAEKRFEMMNSMTAGELMIGASDTICMHYLLPVLESYHECYPDIKISVTNRVTADTCDELKSGKIDLAFINLPYAEASNDSQVVIKEALKLHDVFVAGNKYTYLKGKALSLTDISSLPLIMLEKKSNSRQRIDDYFTANGITISPEIELGSHELLIEFAAVNLGVSCVTKEFSGSALECGKLFELELQTPLPSRSIGICTLSGVSLCPAATNFLDMLYDVYDAEMQ